MNQFILKVNSQKDFDTLARQEKGFTAFSEEIETTGFPANLLIGTIGDRLAPLSVIEETEVEERRELVLSIEGK